MKKIYTLLLATTSFTLFAQQTISFESNENYYPGSINNQNGWEVTEGNNGFIENQTISDTFKSNGNYSFKNGYESDFTPKPYPIFGATKTFDNPIPYSNFSISFDVLVTGKLGSDFEFVLFSINQYNEWTPVAGVGIENRGYIYLIKNENYGFDYADSVWTPNQWNNIKISFEGNLIKYYVNNVLQNSINNFTNLNILGFNMLHNNYGNDAYFDNFIITSPSLSNSIFNKDELSIYPNPTTEKIFFQSNGLITEAKLFDISGKLLSTYNNPSEINLSKFSDGIYIIETTSVEGYKTTKKIIKK